ncbi:probable disease resistance protein At4g27220 [Cornus florida]|uniref:probable disease resistance protein At4g27220 n=1 Tax=Cornus florida TaxID=4283 RepID=UPI00289C9B84|nr:probable disease resistance protein At4g27220 [Cornus florida]XP_059655108.1 probable disease resistance protein At4g27220 [Cornus florida]
MVQWDVITDETKRDYKNLLDGASDLIRRFERLQQKYNKVHRKSAHNSPGGEIEVNEPDYFYGSPRFFKLANISKHFDKLTKDVETQTEKMKGMTWKKPAQVKKEDGADNIDDIKYLNDRVGEIFEYLREDEVRTIGIWGFPGVGKTTILKILNDKMDGNPMFDIVIWANVPEEDNDIVMRMQQQIIDRLELNKETGDANTTTTSREQNANTISKILAEKKYLVILDRVYSNINLVEVGIIRGEHTGGKVVFASGGRSFMVELANGGRSFRKADRDIEIKRLEEKYALVLFRQLLGDVVSTGSIMEEIAEQMVKHLGGLLKLIKGLTTHLKNCDSDEHTWQQELMTLQSPVECQQDDVEDIFKFFTFICEKLNVEWKKCLLYTASCPTSYEIDEDNLVECWATEQLFQINSTYRHIFSVSQIKGHMILRNLINRCLLERHHLSNYITMPQPFRNWATRMFNRLDGEESRAKRVYLLMCSTELHSLPQTPECVNASTLLIRQSNAEQIELPGTVFGDTQTPSSTLLQVLNFQQTGIESLPSSLFHLTTLKGLYLNGCQHLRVLPTEIQALATLVVLDIRSTGIDSLPNEIGELYGTLRCFRVSFRYDATSTSTTPTPERVLIPSNVIKRLCSLEELTIFVDPREQSWNESIVDNIAMEMGSLRLLSSLCFYFPSQECLTTFITNRELWKNATTEVPWANSHRFRSYKMQVGGCHGRIKPDELHSSGSSNDSRCRHFVFSDGREITSKTAEVLKQASTFELIRHKGFHSLSQFGMGNMESLKVCVIEHCTELKSVFSGTGGGSAFLALEKLHINGCLNLLKVFSHQIAQLLIKLRDLKVENCSEVKEIIEIDNKDIDLSGTFPKLENLHLVNLTRLTYICWNDSLNWPSLKKYEIKDCGDLENNTPLSLVFRFALPAESQAPPHGGNESSARQNADVASSSASAGVQRSKASSSASAGDLASQNADVASSSGSVGGSASQNAYVVSSSASAGGSATKNADVASSSARAGGSATKNADVASSSASAGGSTSQNADVASSSASAGGSATQSQNADVSSSSASAGRSATQNADVASSSAGAGGSATQNVDVTSSSASVGGVSNRNGSENSTDPNAYNPTSPSSRRANWFSFLLRPCGQKKNSTSQNGSASKPTTGRTPSNAHRKKNRWRLLFRSNQAHDEFKHDMGTKLQ